MQNPSSNNSMECCDSEKRFGVLGFTTIWFSHELCKNKQSSRLLQIVVHAYTLCEIANLAICKEKTNQYNFYITLRIKN